jgi:lysophospholipase L1-like esterase
MAYDLTLASATFGTGKYGQCLTGGRGDAANVTPANNQFTLEAWVKFTSTGLMVAVGADNAAWIGAENGKAESRGPGMSTINAGPLINDGTWHHIALAIGASSAVLFVDGASVGTSAVTTQSVRNVGVGAFYGGGFGFSGSLDEVAVTSGAKYTANFTPGAVSNSDPNLIAVWHLDGDGVNSQGLAAPSDTTPPTATAAAVANGTPAQVAITMSEVMDGAFVPAASAFTVAGHTVSNVAVSGTVITLTCTTPFTNGEAARTVSYTQPGANGARDVAGNLLATFSGLAITNNVQVVDNTPPAFVSAQVTNSAPNVIVLTFNENLGAVTPAASAFTPSLGRTVTSVGAPSGATISITVDSAYASGDAITIAYSKPGSNQLQDTSANQVASFAAQPVTNNAPANAWDVSKVLFSPFNWNIAGNSARTINKNAYFRTIFTGSSCVLKLDTTGIVGTPQIGYRLNNGSWTLVAANTPTIALNVPYTSDQKYLLEVIMATSNQGDSRWFTQTTGIKVIGMVLDSGATITKPLSKPLSLFYGDSITDAEGADNAWQGYARTAADLLGYEVGIVAFGSTGLNVSGAGGVPKVTTTYSQIYDGVPRSFTPAPDFIVINEGTNDGATGGQASATTLLNGLLAATPTTTKIVVLRPFNGNQAADLQAAIAACSAPSRCTYVDTTGFYTGGPLHPETGACVADIAPKVAAAIRGILGGVVPPTPPVTIPRTFSITLGDASGAAANLSGLAVNFYEAHSLGSGNTTNASGVLSATAQTTLASGATGYASVLDPATGRHWNGPVTVA